MVEHRCRSCLALFALALVVTAPGAAPYANPAPRCAQWSTIGSAQAAPFDGVIDFDKAVRDPHHTPRFIGADQCGDNRHPNDAGYRAMSEAVDLKLFR